MKRKLISVSLVGGALGAGMLIAGPASGLVLASPPPTHGVCQAADPTPSGQKLSVPGDPTNGVVWVDPAGSAGITGTGGFLYATGGTSGATVQGYQPNSGVNGKVTIPPGSASDVCISPN